MGKAKRYKRDQLLAMLNEDCPEALAAYPSSEAFKFQTIDDKCHLHVGRGYNDKGAGKGMAWVENVGTCKPWLKINRISDGYVEDDNFRYVGCNSAFALAAGSRNFYAWGDGMKALIGFVFVYAGHQETFADFDRGDGYKLLKKVLEAHFRRSQKAKKESEVEESEISTSQVVASSSEDSSIQEHPSTPEHASPSECISTPEHDSTPEHAPTPKSPSTPERSSISESPSTQRTKAGETINITHEAGITDTVPIPVLAETLEDAGKTNTDKKEHAEKPTGTKRKPSRASLAAVANKKARSG